VSAGGGRGAAALVIGPSSQRRVYLSPRSLPLLRFRWRGQEVRIRHDDPLLTRYSPVIVTLQSALMITTGVATPRLVMARERAYT
jgi:hypothetical protein